MICALYSRLHSSKNVSKCLISPLVQDIVLQVLQIWLVWLSFSHGFLFDKLFYSYREDRVSQKRTIVDKSESLHWRSAVKPSIPSFPFHFFLPLLHTRSNRHFLLFCTTATVGQDFAFLLNIRLFRQSSNIRPVIVFFLFSCLQSLLSLHLHWMTICSWHFKVRRWHLTV